MDNKRMEELGKVRLSAFRLVDIVNGAAIGALAVWLLWISTSLLIHFMK